MKNKLFFIFWSLLLLALACNANKSDTGNKGCLLLVGGKEKPVRAIERFIKHCDNGLILVIPSASSIPFESGPAAVALFKKHGAQNVDWLNITDTLIANTDSIVNVIKQAGGIFFTGGVQSRLMKRLGGTKSENAIRSLYFEKSGIIGGTSAGAAVQSEIMITGDGDFTILEKENIVTAKGFGFLKNCIIDQHFVVRQRNNRLLNLVIENGLPGIGVDESTAILYNPDDTFEVFGKGSVIVYDPRDASIPKGQVTKKLTIENLRLSVLYDRQIFDLKTGKIIIVN